MAYKTQETLLREALKREEEFRAKTKSEEGVKFSLIRTARIKAMLAEYLSEYGVCREVYCV